MTLEPEMDKKSFLQAGHTPTLIAAFLYFDLAFMVWVILGPLAVGIAAAQADRRGFEGDRIGPGCPGLGQRYRRYVRGLDVDDLDGL